jgi:hypothetical protein
MITEGGMLSGNSALMSGARRSSAGFLTKLPFAQFWGPYVVKATRFAGYQVTGEQPIDNVSRFPAQAWVVVTHDPRDYTVPFVNAQALVGGLGLREGASKGPVALIPVENPVPCHINIMTNPENRAERNETAFRGPDVDAVDNAYTRRVAQLVNTWRAAEQHAQPSSEADVDTRARADTCRAQYEDLTRYERRVRGLRFWPFAVSALGAAYFSQHPQ